MTSIYIKQMFFHFKGLEISCNVSLNFSRVFS